MANLRCFLDDRGGAVGIGDMVDFFQISPRWTREWAEDNDVPRVENAFVAFVFTIKQAQSLADDLSEEDDEDLDRDEDTDDDGGCDGDDE